MRRAVRTENMMDQRPLAAPAGHPTVAVDGARPISIGGAIGMAAAIVTTLLLMSVPAEGAEATGEPAQMVAKLVPADTTSLSQLMSSVPEGAPDAPPPDRCWYGPCRDATTDSPGGHLLRPATGTELYTKQMQHMAPTPKRLRKVGEKHLGLRLLESVYAVVGIPAPAFAPTMRAPSAPQRIDVGLRFVKRF